MATTGTGESLSSILTQAGFSGAGLQTALEVAGAESNYNPLAHGDAATGEPNDDSYGLFQINMLGSMGPARLQQFGLTSNDQLFDPLTNAKAAYQISNGGQNWDPWTTYTSGAYLSHAGQDPVLQVSATANAKAPSGATIPYNGPINKATPAQLIAIRAYITKHLSTAQIKKLSPQEGVAATGTVLNTLYAAAIVAAGGSLGPVTLNPTSGPNTYSGPFAGVIAALEKIASWLSSGKNWERIGMFAGGALILGFAVWKLLGSPDIPTGGLDG